MQLVVLASPGAPTDILVNFLDDQGLPPAAVLIEPAQSRRALLRGRARRLGWWAVLGQVLFLGLALPIMRRRAGLRLATIRRELSLRADPLPASRVTRIASVNAWVKRGTAIWKTEAFS